MDIQKTTDGSKLTMAVSGRLDTNTAPKFETELKSCLDGVLDFSGLDYISSAGLRVLLSVQKLMNAGNGSMQVTGCNEIVKEIFEVTGFTDILIIN